MTGVRFRADVGFEGRCDQCREWWPLADRTCWEPSHGLKRCRACQAEAGNARNRVRRSDAAVRALARELRRAYRAAHPEVLAQQRRDYYIANRERILANARRRYHERGEAAHRLTYKRDWMRIYREGQKAA